MSKTIETWLENRVSALTGKSQKELTDMGVQLNSHAFMVAKETEARIIDKIRPVFDAYSANKITMHDAQRQLRELVSGEAGDITRSLAVKARAEFVLRTQKQMAQAVGEWKEMMDPAVKSVYPFLIYHTNKDGFVRPSHKALDGNVYSKDDPFLRSHWPGSWDYNCRCWGEECTAERAAKLGVVPMSPKPVYDAESGFAFNPADAFSVNDLTAELEPKTRQMILDDITGAIRSGKLKKIGLMVGNAQKPFPKADLNGLGNMTKAMRQHQAAAEKSVKAAGLDPAKMPDYKAQEAAYKTAKAPDLHTLPSGVSASVKVGEFSPEAMKAMGLPGQKLEIVLETGTKEFGLAHNWQHHKEVFTRPDLGEKIIKATLGNPKAEIVVSLKNAGKGMVSRVVTVHDPRTGAYCVGKIDAGDKFQIMSYHRAPVAYGNKQWELQ